VVLRVSRFFPEADDRDTVRATYTDANVNAYARLGDQSVSGRSAQAGDERGEPDRTHEQR
jgi:hypothetical protein